MCYIPRATRCRLPCWERLGLGSDLDGGFGLERAPAGIERYGDVWRVLDALDGEEERGEVAVTAQQRAGLEGGGAVPRQSWWP